ncbi:zinc ribbon domain-containing protein [Rhodovulum sp. ES.010]|uniref:FmdB family zinc ribbon protein n=1 Tax=Rhodovulum sp. ES.010 TaxID=1882821 RepID=UPI0020C96F9C|nr:zinc ribbon domain-containing protein [Rhodovulum sp. ES.010]
MPYYDYCCDACGPFTGFAAMAEFNKPTACPDCGAATRRAFFTPPKLAIVGSATGQAHETNEPRSTSRNVRATARAVPAAQAERRRNPARCTAPTGRRVFRASVRG